MELKEFVKNTLLGIVDGVHEATEGMKSRKYDELPFKQFSIQDMEKTENRYIDFDVAVTTSHETSGKIEGSGKIYVASVGMKGFFKHGSENVSRVQFKVWCGH